MKSTLATVLTLGALGAAGLSLAPAAAASGGGGHGVRTSGSCSAGAHWTLKAKHDDGVIEVEGQVDSNRAGQNWRWSITDNGHRVKLGPARTAGASGSFSIERRIADRAGTDRIVFRAKRPATGQLCQGVVSL